MEPVYVTVSGPGARAQLGRWRREARDVIAAVFAETQGMTEDRILARIDAAYPFGERRNYPYKAWLRERRIALAQLRGHPLDAATGRVAIPPPYRPRPELDAWLARQESIGAER